MSVFKQRDFVAGLMFALFGLSVVVASTNYPMGTLSSMGPGYFPFWLGVLLVIFGSVVLVGDIMAGSAKTKTPHFNLKALGIVLASILAFMFLLRPIGLFGCIAGTVVVASYASHQFGWVAAIVNAVVLATFCMLVFVYGIGLHLPLWPSFLLR